MSENESKHDKILKRLHLWVAVLGGIVGLAIGLYNFKSLFFPSKATAKTTFEVPAVSAPPPASAALPGRTADLKIRQYDWKGSAEDFSLLDLDGNGVLNAQDFKGTDFKTMDRNGDGSIEPLEWRKSRRAFARLDADGDGRVSPAEFAAHERAAAAFDTRT